MKEHTTRSGLEAMNICLNICGEHFINSHEFVTHNDMVVDLMVAAYNQGQLDAMDYVHRTMNEMTRRYKNDQDL